MDEKHRAALEKIQELHAPVKVRSIFGSGTTYVSLCSVCHPSKTGWPCPTYETATEALA